MYRTVLIAGATAAAIAGGGAAALAATGPSSTDGTPAPSSSSSSSSSSNGSTGSSGTSTHAAKKGEGKKKDGKKGARRMLRHVDHADIVVHTKKGFVTREIIRGTVTSVSSSSITVASADHTTRTFSVTKDTSVRTRSEGKATDSSISHVSKGEHVLVAGVATKSGGTAVARRVFEAESK